MAAGRANTPKRCTLRDVARFAGVSPMTASNVVNGRFSSMTRETRARVEDAIKQLNYRPHNLARILRLSRNFTIGMLIVDPSPAFLTMPFTTHLVAGLSNYLSESGYQLALQGVRPETFHNALALKRIGTDGLCAFLSGTVQQRESFHQQLKESGQPFVTFQDFSDDHSGDFCRICQEDFEGGRFIARHVISRGARRLAAMSLSYEWPAFTERLKGIQAAVDETNGAVTLDIIACATSSATDTEVGLRRYLEKHPVPDCVLGANDQIGIDAMRFLISQRYRVPEDVMVTGFNGLGIQHYAPIALTTMRSPAYDMGVRGGMEMLR